MASEPAITYPFIAGRPDRSRDDHVFANINPATEEPVSATVQSDQHHVDEAIAAADTAQSVWWRTPPDDRTVALQRWSDLVARDAETLALLDTVDMGRPLRDSRAQVPGAVGCLRYWAGLANRLWGQQLPVLPGHLSYTLRRPIGVVGVILPSSDPLGSFVGSVATALACGNAVVVKPSEISPRSAVRLARLGELAGLPRGLVDVVTGDGKVGAMLAGHPGIGAISFTGSVAAGRRVNETASRTFKKVVLEMGGKSPNIMFADADLDSALRSAVWSVFANTGQACSAGTRLLVEASIAGDVTARVTDLARRIRVGDPMDDSVHIGPVASRPQYERVRDYVRIGRSEATLMVGGSRPQHLPGKGFFIAPTVFTDVGRAAAIAREEIFGPVLAVMAFNDEEEAVALANDVDLGLTATVWTRDVGRLLRLSGQLQVGTVWGNTTRVYHPAFPFEGHKQSGLGNGAGDNAIEGYTRLTRVSIRCDEDAQVPGWVL
jgi:acyl-CoA reductase-like NAD-dependent aldehyde dehydrogenase